MTTLNEAFLHWLQTNGASVDLASIGIMEFPPSEGGRGAIAKKDIPEGHVLFSIPRALTLSTRTSSLPTLFGLEIWKMSKLHEGWSGLILCMMWEAAQKEGSRWAGYLNILPSSFDTPMFWNEDDLAELKGTSIVDKIGKEDAQKEYELKVRPAVESRPDLFLENDLTVYYSLEMYHIMGSRILSRSFNVEKWEHDHDDEDNAADKSTDSAMDVDTAAPGDQQGPEDGEAGHEEDGDEEEEDSSDVAMVPMADMLNARFGTENAKLFHEELDLKMISTKDIKAGEQIWNTYGDLPNAELLRRYGHVDLLPLPQGGEGNPGDIVEIRADVIVDSVKEMHPSISADSVNERIDWWLEEGGDDTFEFESDLEYPPGPLSISRLLLLSEIEWQKARDKGKPPKPKVESDILQILQKVVERRLHEYPTTIDDDEKLLQTQLSLNRRHAVVVRLGEKKILQGLLQKIKSTLPAQGQSKKRKQEISPSGKNQKKSRR